MVSGETEIGSENFNEIRMEDKKGEEQLYIHAEKNQDIVVENDETHSVGHDRSKTIGNDETTKVGHDRTETVGRGGAGRAPALPAKPGAAGSVAAAGSSASAAGAGSEAWRAR